MSVLIKGGRVVTASDTTLADVYVEGERIALIGASLEVEADVVIDATGKLVLPGAIDPHTHLDMPFGGTVTVDDVTSGQTAAAFGGTTCHVDFVIQTPGESFADALATWHGKRDGKAIIDNGFHMAVTDLHDGGSLEELATLPAQGVTSYKLFMAYKGALMVDDETLFRTMHVAHQTGALVMVHAENGDAIDVLVKDALAAGHTEPVWHARTRPPELEGEATNRAIQLARIAGAPLYVVHVTCKDAVDAIKVAREKHWNVWGETCTQYFFTDITDLEEADFGGAKYVFSPPVRDKANDWSRRHGLHDKFVFLYTGTLGMKHNPELLLGLAEKYRSHENVRIVVISEGIGAEWLAAKQKEKQLANLVLLPYQDFHALPEVLATGDILCAVLEEDAGVFSVPSKVLTYLCAARPPWCEVQRQQGKVQCEGECGDSGGRRWRKRGSKR